jgi:hypothetical protein
MGRRIVRKPQLRFVDKLTGQIFITDQYSIAALAGRGVFFVEAISPYTKTTTRAKVGRSKLPNTFIISELTRLWRERVNPEELIR